MSPRPPFFHRAVALMALSCLLPQAERAQEQDDLVEDLLRRFWGLAPDLATPEVRAALVGDLKARVLAGPSLGRACGELGDLLDRWVNAERKPVVAYDEPAPAGSWGARVVFRDPGVYWAESRRFPEGTRGEVQVTTGLATLPEAIEVARRLLQHEQTAGLSMALDEQRRALAKLGPAKTQALKDYFAEHPEAKVAVVGIADRPDVGEQWRQLRESLLEASAKAPAVMVGETQAGPYTPMEELSADEFTRRYGIHDDLVREPPSPEQRAKMEAWMDSITSPRPPVSRAGWSPEDAFARAQRMAMNTSADRAMVGKTGPVDFKGAGERSRARRNINAPTAADIHAAERIEASLHPAGRCTCEGAGNGTCSWCVMNRRREARDDRPTRRDGQASRRRQRAGQKARRGW